ncbi:PREDICTED: polyadenylate-binding protein, cytoplasmic and nuclear-like [Chinchilla lanigera]|uniref:polyadenylate-binding protein, cytoplasmic and nuclear-like n=1 Tax=Chinchilla lanigera TaxID=34839 RepID=UPI00038E96BB|nr:PREDICTED: polyadenylate-binding protein, cytoplasmic and nuclear-like [Chinchilla lanigera]
MLRKWPWPWKAQSAWDPRRSPCAPRTRHPQPSLPAVQGGSGGHPGRGAAARRGHPAAAQVPRELPEPLRGPGAAAPREHQPEGGGQGGNQSQEGGRESAARRGEVQLGPRRLRAEDAGLGAGEHQAQVAGARRVPAQAAASPVPGPPDTGRPPVAALSCVRCQLVLCLSLPLSEETVRAPAS